MFFAKNVLIALRYLIFLLPSGTISTAMAQVDSSAVHYSPPGKLVDIGGWRLYARNFRLWATSRYEYYAANDNNAEIHELASIIKYQQGHPQYLAAIPLIVLTRGSNGPSGSDPAELERKQVQAVLQNLSSNSKQIIAHERGHHIEVDDPNLVTTSILEVVEAVRKKARLVC